MKIYKASISYNNGDCYECGGCEEWYTEESPWYTDRTMAEKHLKELLQFRDYILNENIENNCFTCLEPVIIEDEVMMEQTELVFKNTNFKPLNYLCYPGECKITKVVINAIYDFWQFCIIIDNTESFRVNLGNSGVDIEHNDGYSKYYYHYEPSERDRLVTVVKNFVYTIKPNYIDYLNCIKEPFEVYSKLCHKYSKRSEVPDYYRLRSDSYWDWSIEEAKAMLKLIKQFPIIKISDHVLIDPDAITGSDYSDDKRQEYTKILSDIRKLNQDEETVAINQL